MRPTTLRGYRQIIRDHVVPAIGDRPIAGPWTGAEFDFVWRTRHLNFYPEIPRVKPNTRHNIRSVLHQLFAYAVQRGKLDRNPVDHPWNRIKGRSLQPCDIEVSADDAARIIEAVRGSSVEGDRLPGPLHRREARRTPCASLARCAPRRADPHVWFGPRSLATWKAPSPSAFRRHEAGTTGVTLNPDAVQLLQS